MAPATRPATSGSSRRARLADREREQQLRDAGCEQAGEREEREVASVRLA
jgi:hypothetical protein